MLADLFTGVKSQGKGGYAYRDNAIVIGVNNGKLGKVYLMSVIDGGNIYYDVTLDNGYDFYFRNSGTSTIYRAVSTKYIYEYWRWGSWSGWGDWTTRQSDDGISLKEDLMVMYYVVGGVPN